jgi:hypothetical protein
MLSRRRFLLGSVAGLGVLGEIAGPALAKKAPKHAASESGPRVLSRQSWSPASSADFIGLIDNDRCCLIDETGRLTIVDLSKSTDEAGTAGVLGELDGIGKKILDVCFIPKKAYALVTAPAEASGAQFTIVTIDLSRLDAPQIVSKTPLSSYADCFCISANQDTLSVGGISSSGENLVAFYGAGRGKNLELTKISIISLPAVIKSMDLQERTLAVLHGPDHASLSLISLNNPRDPQLKQEIHLDEDYSEMARVRDVVVLGGNSEKSCLAKVVMIGGKAPRVLKPVVITGVTSLIAITGQKDRYLFLGESSSGHREVVPFRLDKNANLIEQNIVHFPMEKEQTSAIARLSMGNGVACIASGWSGVQTLSLSGDEWNASRKYTIPRLPAAGLATWANFVVVAGADLKLYDIAQPDKPSLVASALLPSAVKAVASAGSYVLCLSKDSLSLRKIDSLDRVVTSLDVTGQQMCFDPIEQNAYLIKQEKDKTIVSRLKVYSDSILTKDSFELKPGFSHAIAYGGNLLIGGLNDLSLYGITEQSDLIGSIHIENLGLRDFALGVDAIFVTAVDQNSKGTLLALSKDKDQLKPLSSTEIPHDGVAIALSGKTLATVGSTTGGKSLITLIDVSSPESPKVIKSLPALDSASSVAIKDKLAIIAGRGLEIVSLT